MSAGVSRALPPWISLACPLSSLTLPPISELWPGQGRCGPSHARCRVVRVPPLGTTPSLDKKLKSSSCGGGGELDSKQLKDLLVFYWVQSQLQLRPTEGCTQRAALEAHPLALVVRRFGGFEVRKTGEVAWVPSQGEAGSGHRGPGGPSQRAPLLPKQA